jgi:hypothetical protein
MKALSFFFRELRTAWKKAPNKDQWRVHSDIAER